MDAKVSDGWVDKQALAQTVLQLCRSQRTGTLFCTTDNGVSATIGLRNGAIVALSYKTLRGNAALPALVKIARLRYRFKDAVLLQLDTDLSDSAVILETITAAATPTAGAAAALQTLAADHRAIAAEPPAIAAEPPAIVAEPPAIAPQSALDSLAVLARSASADRELTAPDLPLPFGALRDIMIDEATNLFGPIGHALVMEQLQRQGRPRHSADLQHLLDRIVASAGSPELTDVFADSVLHRVND